MRMKSFINDLLFLLLVTIGLFSCSKEKPMDVQGNVVFRFNGTIDSRSTVFEAGENNYYLKTSYQDNGADDVLLMRGEFLDKTDPTDNYLRFEFFGYDSANNANILQNVFNQVNFNSFSSDSTFQSIGSTVLKFNSIYGTGGNISWNFGDGTIGTGDSITHSFSPNSLGSNVTMSAFYPSVVCSDSVTNFINLDDPVNGQVQFNVSALGLSLDSFELSATQGFANYSWDFGNQTTQQGINSVVQVTYNDSLRKTITLNATGSLLTSSWKAVITPKNTCFAAFTYSVLSLPSTTSSLRVPYKTCIVTYRRNGITYRSYKDDITDQSMRNIFSLKEAQAYENNPEGQRTIRLIGSVNTFLYNENDLTDSIAITSSDVSIAVAHP